MLVMWHGGSSAEIKCVDKQNGQPVECFYMPWGLSRGLPQLLTIKKWVINKKIRRVSEEFFGMIKVCVCVDWFVVGSGGRMMSLLWIAVTAQ
jgi:hypothetical protein